MTALLLLFVAPMLIGYGILAVIADRCTEADQVARHRRGLEAIARADGWDRPTPRRDWRDVAEAIGDSTGVGEP